MGTTSIVNPTIFPSHNDIAPTEHDGDRGTEPSLSAWANLLTNGNFIASGFIPSNGGGLILQISTGYVWLSGRKCYMPGTTNHALTASSTNYVYIQVVLDGNNYATELRVNSNVTGIPPTNSILLCKATTDGSSILSIADERNLGPKTNSGFVLIEHLIPTVAVDTINFATALDGNNEKFYLLVGRWNNPVTGGGGTGILSLKFNISASLITMVNNGPGAGGNGNPHFFFAFICAKDTVSIPLRLVTGHYIRSDGNDAAIAGLVNAGGNITTITLSAIGGGVLRIGPSSSFLLYKFQHNL